MTTISDRPTVDGASKAPTPSRKPHLAGSRPDLRVPMREVLLSTGDSVVLYDTSGPYTDPSVTTDLKAGLPRLRQQWIDEREPVDGAVTQLAYARRGIVTAEMEFVAIREG